MAKSVASSAIPHFKDTYQTGYCHCMHSSLWWFNVNTVYHCESSGAIYIFLLLSMVFLHERHHNFYSVQFSSSPTYPFMTLHLTSYLLLFILNYPCYSLKRQSSIFGSTATPIMLGWLDIQAGVLSMQSTYNNSPSQGSLLNSQLPLGVIIVSRDPGWSSRPRTVQNNKVLVNLHSVIEICLTANCLNNKQSPRQYGEKV